MRPFIFEEFHSNHATGKKNNQDAISGLLILGIVEVQGTEEGHWVYSVKIGGLNLNPLRFPCFPEITPKSIKTFDKIPLTG